MAAIKTWIQALRIPFTTASVLPVILGLAIAWSQGNAWNWGHALLVIFAVAFLHLGTNAANDIYDHYSGNDAANQYHNAFSGGSRVIQEGKLSPREILFASLSLLFAGLLLGMVIAASLQSWTLAFLALAGFLCGFFYTAPPFRLGYLGIGEFLVCLMFGPIAVLVGYFALAQGFDLLPLLASIPVGILVMLILLLAEMPDLEADKKTAKKTFVVLFGRERAVYFLAISLLIAYLFVGTGVALRIMPPLTLLMLLTLPLAVGVLKKAKKHALEPMGIVPAIGGIITLHAATTAILIITFIALALIG